MVSANPFGEFRKRCKTTLTRALKSSYPKISIPPLTLETPPSPQFGDLSSSVCFELAKQTSAKPIAIAERIIDAVDISRFPLIQSVEAAGEGYINFHVHLARFSSLTIESARALNTEYGYVKADKLRKIIVEHTSVNPASTIHIGNARNPILGDSLARILKARGHEVFKHYYVDDVGRQTAIMTYGYKSLGKPKPEGKADQYIAAIYAVTSCIVEIRRLKEEIEKAKERSTSEEVLQLQRELDDWVSIAADLEGRFPEIFQSLLKAIEEDEDPESKVNQLIREYEAGEKEAKQLVRDVCQLCLGGFKETLGKGEIFFDSWDWESDHIWSSDVKSVLEKLQKTPYVDRVGGVLEFNAEKVARNLDLKGKLGLREDYEIPSLTLVRADGTTLYTTRDIPYSLWKFKKAERVINVIGMEQTLAQLQLKLALYALGYKEYAENLIHFVYNLVRLPGYKMSSRRGRYVTFDEVMNGAVERAYEEVSKRSPQLSAEEKRRISKFVGIGAVKYALVEVDPMKPVVFTWDRVLDFEKNSAPYIQYSHARACSIFRKAARAPENPDYSLLRDSHERNLVIMVSQLPEIFVNTAENLRPNTIADFANALADKFNAFYTALPVLRAEPPELSDSRLALVDATRIVFRNCLNLLGIVAPERM
jgi:arginyl-tRNA synthetase